MSNPHDLAMAAGQGAMAAMDAFSDETTIALAQPAAKALHELAENLRSNGYDQRFISQVLVGFAIAAAHESIL